MYINQKSETIHHLFFFCPYSNIFWKHFKNYFTITKQVMALSLKDIIIGITTLSGEWKILRILARKWNILKDLNKNLEASQRIFNDLQSSCQDLWRSAPDLQGSWQENGRSLMILTRTLKILVDLGKKMKDPWRSSKIFKDPHEVSQEDPQRS